MRAIALILVILGALGLGFPELGNSGKKQIGAESPFPKIAALSQSEIPPVMSGIALTSGLILMASGLKRR